MSFKREGDDQSQLNVLKKRRVADLLSHFIPEDEAVLMKNGRYSCLVCSHRPVFDTVDMLTVHRTGKRHLAGLNWFYGKKSRLQHEINKRRHQDYVNREDVNREDQEAEHSAPLLAQTRRITHHALLRGAPYSSCHRRASEKTETVGCGSERLAVRDDGVAQSHTAVTSSSSTQPSPVYGDITSGQGQTRSQTKSKKKLSSASRLAEAEAEALPEQRCRELEHYLKLKSAGWLHDPSGKWVKDENVEFDSDEEEPRPLLPPSDTT